MWNLSTSGEARTKVGGQRTGILKKNLYFEALFKKIYNTPEKDGKFKSLVQSPKISGSKKTRQNSTFLEI